MSSEYQGSATTAAVDEEEVVGHIPIVEGQLDCRFYENQYPEVEDLVLVNVGSIAEMGAYVSLLEYNHQEGMILLSELSRRRIRSINKLIRVGKNEIVMVLRVDKEKGGAIGVLNCDPGPSLGFFCPVFMFRVFLP